MIVNGQHIGQYLRNQTGSNTSSSMTASLIQKQPTEVWTRTNNTYSNGKNAFSDITVAKTYDFFTTNEIGYTSQEQ